MPAQRRRRRSSVTSSWSSAGRTTKQLVPQTEVFDGESWKQAADLPTPREHLAAVSDGAYVYTVGGRFLSSDKNSAAFERFDPESGNWEKLVDMPTPRGSFGAAYIDGRIVAVGGEEPTRVLATAEMYDIADGKWTTVAPMPTPRHAEVVAAVGSTLYCIGGADRPTHEGPVRPSRPWTRIASASLPVSLFVSAAVAQHGEGDGPASDGLIGKTDPTLSLRWDIELLVQVLQMLFDGRLRNE